ncbi:MAG: TRZ/ATZ family hydrolase [Pseudazoarcus pumilus]|nr:TRZ/ATZ family hydrolase [Pseudazoarcus pumilus]
MPLEPADLIINARWVIPMDAADSVLHHQSVVVSGGRIRAIVPQSEARVRFNARQLLDLPEHVLIPGLVNAHTHAAMSLLRGIADDLPLMRWLQEAIWPAEGKHVSANFVRDGTLLAAAEMLAGGITTCNDMYFHPDAAAEAFDRAGMRAVIGVTVIDFPTPYAANADEYFRKGLAARDHWQRHPRLHFNIAPHAPYTASDETLTRAASLAAELDCGLHIHIHETKQEVEDSIRLHGMRPLTRLAGLGLPGSNFLGVHAVHMDRSDIEILARHGCATVHCPSSNMKLASGISPVVEMLNAGITVALGTDGAASNNRLDMFAEMRQAALLAKVSTGDATSVPAHTALRMATLNGANALGLGDRIGSLEAGKQADICAVRLGNAETLPCYDPASHLVYAAGREHVSHVWVDGELRIQNDTGLLHANNTELIATARLWQSKLES